MSFASVSYPNSFPTKSFFIALEKQDENGNDVVYVVTRTESGGITKAAVPVTVGVEGDYYVEVTGDIQEGMEVSMPSDMKFDFSQMMAMGS